jgi:type I restriction enzyme S subunit
MIDNKDIPAEWRLETIGSIATNIQTGGTPARSADEYWGGDIPWKASKHFNKDRLELDSTSQYVTEKGRQKTTLANEGEVLIVSRGAHTGKVGITEQTISFNQDVKVIELSEYMISKFVGYFLMSRFEYFKNKQRGGTTKGITTSHIESLNIPVPPLDEQKRIVDIVEERLERVGQLKKSVESLGRLSEEYEKSILSFSTVGKEATKESSVNGIPEQQDLPDNWDAVQLSQVANVNPRVSHNEQEEYAYVPMGAVSADEKVITRYERRESLYSGLAKFCEGDIIVARITPCFENGKMAIASELPEENEFAVGSTEFVVIRPTGIDPGYLFSYLKSPIVRQWGRHHLLGATGRERIKISQFRNELIVPVPPEEIQSQIAKEIKQNDFGKIRTVVNTVQNMFKEYQNSVLAHAIKGKI